MKKKVFLTGASGTVGKAFIKEYSNLFDIYSYSRNEKSQVALKREFPNVEIIIGSIEDIHTLECAVAKLDIDIMIHAAALKHVDTAEKQPSQAVKINLLGTLNVLETCQKYNIRKVIGISTDKACDPDNVYGMSKYLMEKLFEEYHSPNLITVCCRFGNVAWSNGSVLPFWLNVRESNKPLPLTDIDMTRLIFTSKEAAKLIYKSIELTDDLDSFFVLSKKMKSCKMVTLAGLISDQTTIIGLRAGEILSEDLISRQEVRYAYELSDDKAEYIVITKNYQSNLLGQKLTSPVNSSTAEEMDKEGMIELLEDVTNHISTHNSIRFNY
ncbi:polysaccharide biosynthesis protein [Akkermansiaceae bacterium]|nr:polysaccharide biosynthesis protein [Akkermansiaceae bacterium]